ncbi:hypothetical protein [Paraburkholderia sp. RAU2J]|nr:hypothetical protein [Paraburkholderia sp. RAU2J]
MDSFDILRQANGSTRPEPEADIAQEVSSGDGCQFTQAQTVSRHGLIQG